MTDDRALVLTADVIAPLVDDPETFGAIAATNSMSDVYAMGGSPRFALNLVFFPDDKLSGDVLQAILRGGAMACERAGVAVVGGHSVRDSEVKFGLSVTGEVAPQRILSNRGGKPGDKLILTKPLGTGIIGTAIKNDVASEAEAGAAIESMTTHNGLAIDACRDFNIHACTDVTGFGLLGHLRNILVGSSLGARLFMNSLPILPGTLEHIAAGRVPGGSRSNLAFLEEHLSYTGNVDESLKLVVADAQTSGGLLLAVDPEQVAEATGALADAGSLSSAVVGELYETEDVGATELLF
jgi:selenide,water dikinase